jgi:MFS family permease
MGIIEKIENPVIAFLLCFGGMAILGFAFPAYWIFLFSIICAYIICDLALNLFIIGGSGIAQIPVTGNKSQEKGHAYIAFFVGIIVATLISSIFSGMIMKLIQSYEYWLVAMVIASFLIGLVVYADMKAKFYTHKKR